MSRPYFDQGYFEAALAAPFNRPTKGQLTRRFNSAFRATRHLLSAMSAVNEVIERPLTYQEFFASLKEKR